jgi:hypothetical protein
LSETEAIQLQAGKGSRRLTGWAISLAEFVGELDEFPG